MHNQTNEDFQAELAALRGDAPRIENLKAPQNEIDESKATDVVLPEQIFDKTVLAGNVPTLNSAFIMEKSRQDSLVELGQIAQEVYVTKKVSRGQVISMESIARNLIPATESEASSGERKVIVSDHEVNMFTEEPSRVEVGPTIVNCQANIDRITGDLRHSASDLGRQLVATANADKEERNEKLMASVVQFNEAIKSFLKETQSKSLESSDIKFKRDVTWGSLMAVPLSCLLYLDTVDTKIKPFAGTSAEVLLKELHGLFESANFSYYVAQGFAKGSPTIVRDFNDAVFHTLNQDNSVARSHTVGDLFHGFGSSKFALFYNFHDNAIETQVTAAKAAVALLEGETSIETIMQLSTELQNQQKAIMDISANLAVLNHIQYLVIRFLKNF